MNKALWPTVSQEFVLYLICLYICPAFPLDVMHTLGVDYVMLHITNIIHRISFSIRKCWSLICLKNLTMV